MILIFDDKGKYLCSTETYTQAAKITGASTGNIHRVVNNTDIITANGYFFLEGGSFQKVWIRKVEMALRIILDLKVIGLKNKIDVILKATYDDSKRKPVAEEDVADVDSPAQPVDNKQKGITTYVILPNGDKTGGYEEM